MKSKNCKKLSKIARKHTPINITNKIVAVWCGDGAINDYWKKKSKGK